MDYKWTITNPALQILMLMNVVGGAFLPAVLDPGAGVMGHPHPLGRPQHQQGQGLILEHIIYQKIYIVWH